ncbi:tRNA(m(1)G37)methyltransferase, partial [Spiromyces aspiralis]
MATDQQPRNYDAISPPEHRGMTVLDRDAFTLDLKVIALRIPVKEVGPVLSEFRDQLLNLPRLRNIVSDESDKAKRLVLLGRHVTDTG